MCLCLKTYLRSNNILNQINFFLFMYFLNLYYLMNSLKNNFHQMKAIYHVSFGGSNYINIINRNQNSFKVFVYLTFSKIIWHNISLLFLLNHLWI